VGSLYLRHRGCSTLSGLMLQACLFIPGFFTPGFYVPPLRVVSRSIPRQFGSDHAGKPRPPPATPTPKAPDEGQAPGDSDTGNRMTGAWAVCICGTEAVQPFRVDASACLSIPGFHPGLLCSTPPGWFPDQSHGSLVVTMRPRQFGSDHAGKQTVAAAGDPEGAGQESPGCEPWEGWSFSRASTLKGLNSDPAQSSARSTYHQCLSHRQDVTKIDTTKSC